jgi:hypothetical protein
MVRRIETLDERGNIKSIRVPRRAAAHPEIVKLAIEIGNTIYEQYASRGNVWHKQYPDRLAYVRKVLPYLIEEARATMAKTLATNIDERTKERIHQILIEDQRIRPQGY